MTYQVRKQITGTRVVNEKNLMYTHMLGLNLVDYLQSQSCKICYENESTYLTLPCNHLCCCTDCVATQTHCIICRKKIDWYVKVFKA